MRPPLVALVLALAPGCIATGRTTVTTTTRVGATLSMPTFNPAVTATVAAPPGMQVLQAQCQPGGEEACNGVDDNCNGAIDEGCGYSGGNIQVTAAWQTASDIDLHVTDPTGAEVFYGARSSASGGVLDHDANAACRAQPPTVENVYWNSPTPPRGRYTIRVVSYDQCGVPVTPTTLSLSVGGRVLGTWRMEFTRQGESFTIPFDVP